MPTAKARVGEDLLIRERVTPFSFWPTGEGTRRDFLQSRLFASNPWELIRNNASRRVLAADRPFVDSLILQGEDLFKAAAAADIKASRPLLLYYAFLQLTKAYSIVRNTLPAGIRVQHGIEETLPIGGAEFRDSTMNLYARMTARGGYNAFGAFYEALTGTPLVLQSITLPRLFNQILIGHRLFTQHTGESERFVATSSVHFLQDSTNRSIWIQFRVPKSELSRLGYPNNALLTVPGMRQLWSLRRVEGDEVPYELASPVLYTGRPSDIVRSVAEQLMPFVWVSVLTAAPYRRYYLYKASGISPILPQLASIFAVFYYLGSLTRYRPSHFRNLINDPKYGPSISEFLQNQPMQFLYLLTSLFARQEVSQAAIV